MHITLLTHPREALRKTNSGMLASQLKFAQKVIWQRKQPDKHLLDRIKAKKTALLFPLTTATHHMDQTHLLCSPITPVSDISEHNNITAYEHIIVVDGTWQEARKIVNHSPYLLALARCVLTPQAKSLFSLRRNQKPDGLCTAECVIEILNAVGKTEKAALLMHSLIDFIDNYAKASSFLDHAKN